ncbi:hypothetical protein SDC9_212160 [bioreactor metagenome]|uniref:Uncharacterized protein n=1 Tax=bioreactor metagenome TaxID=1076179 RepID=A0A645JL37_9ZZZZ
MYSPIEPSAFMSIAKMSSTPSSDAVTTIAPAPSPNRIEMPLSFQSQNLELLSVATISIVLYIPDEIKAFAISSVYINPEQAAVTSNAGMCFVPSLA